MKINEMTALLSGEARTAAAHADAEIISAYAGDMLSDVLALGFGAGMGLPNIKKYSDDFDIHSEVGKGTTLSITVYAGKESS